MTYHLIPRWLRVFGAVPLILAACQSSYVATPGSASAIVRDSSTLLVSDAAVSAHGDRRASWMAQTAKNDKLLYVSDASADEVNVYSYPELRLVGQLTGLHEPQGECVDDSGNVYVSNTLDSDIVEYAHGGTAPIVVIEDPGQYPVGCAYNRKIVTLAVANIRSVDGEPGSVSIFSHQTVTTYTDPAIKRMRYIGYNRDVTDYLFVDGTGSNGEVRYAKMSAIGNFVGVRLRGAVLGKPGGVTYAQQDREMAVGNGNNVISVTRGPAVLKTITLKEACAVAQYTITRSKVIAPDPCRGVVSVYPYPGGGTPLRTINVGLSKPFGSALSLQPIDETK